MDEAVPSWVKNNYSPRESWKNRPFTRQDALFFLKGVRELSELFTEERPSKMPNYFTHPKYRSSYLLYFLPLQAAKFVTLFKTHPDAIEHALLHARLKGVLRVADLGSGPGTASLALLIHLLDLCANEKDLPKMIELDWFDMHRGILEEGKKLLHELLEIAPVLKDKVVVRTHVRPWTDAPRMLEHPTSLILLGNMLNEESSTLQKPGDAPTDSRAARSKRFSRRDDLYIESDEIEKTEEKNETRGSPEERMERFATSPSFRAIAELHAKAEGGGILLVEPASKAPARLLSILRDTLFEEGTIAKSPAALWGPCLHAGRCPLGTGRDWCHFSVPSDIPGEQFKFFSKGLGSERQWLKFA